MKAANDNNPFHALPLFASDREIARAIVGSAGADRWINEVLPTLRGFPPVDSRHGGRPVPLVKRYYDSYFGLSEDFQARGASGEENWEKWKKPKKPAA